MGVKVGSPHMHNTMLCGSSRCTRIWVSCIESQLFRDHGAPEELRRGRIRRDQPQVGAGRGARHAQGSPEAARVQRQRHRRQDRVELRPPGIDGRAGKFQFFGRIMHPALDSARWILKVNDCDNWLWSQLSAILQRSHNIREALYYEQIVPSYAFSHHRWHCR